MFFMRSRGNVVPQGCSNQRVAGVHRDAQDEHGVDPLESGEGRKLCGNGTPLKERSWCPPEAQITAFTHTANFYRHSLAHPARRNPSKKPMLLFEATEMIRLMATGVLMDEISVGPF